MRRPQRVLNQPINNDLSASTATITTIGGRMVTDHDLQVGNGAMAVYEAEEKVVWYISGCDGRVKNCLSMN